jgi:hypothetical protein
VRQRTRRSQDDGAGGAATVMGDAPAGVVVPTISVVVPAQAGTHNHSWQKFSTLVPHRQDTAYGSPPVRGRRRKDRGRRRRVWEHGRRQQRLASTPPSPRASARALTWHYSLYGRPRATAAIGRNNGRRQLVLDGRWAKLYISAGICSSDFVRAWND